MVDACFKPRRWIMLTRDHQAAVESRVNPRRYRLFLSALDCGHANAEQGSRGLIDDPVHGTNTPRWRAAGCPIRNVCVNRSGNASMAALTAWSKVSPRK